MLSFKNYFLPYREKEENSMLEIVKRFLTEHFPDENHQLFNEVHQNKKFLTVQVCNDNKPKLIFDVVHNHVKNICIHKDYYEKVSSIFNLDAYKKQETIIIKDFIKTINKNNSFKSIFNQIDDFDFYFDLSNKISYDENLIIVSDQYKSFTLSPNFNKLKHSSYIQFPLMFSKKNTLKYIPTIYLFDIDNNVFTLKFDLDNKSVHFIESETLYYEDLFEQNKIFNDDKHLTYILNNYIDFSLGNLTQIKNSDSEIDLNDFNSKISLLKMTNY